MALTLTIVGAVLLTIATILISRWRTADHQEALNTHAEPDDRVTSSPEDLTPKTDRPAGPEAEAMGAETGHPTPEEDRSRTEGHRPAQPDRPR